MSLFDLLDHDDAPPSVYAQHPDSAVTKPLMATCPAPLVEALALHLERAGRCGTFGSKNVAAGHVEALRELRAHALPAWRVGEPYPMYLQHAVTVYAALAISEDIACMSAGAGLLRKQQRAAVDAVNPLFLDGITQLRSWVGKLVYTTKLGGKITVSS